MDTKASSHTDRSYTTPTSTKVMEAIEWMMGSSSWRGQQMVKYDSNCTTCAEKKTLCDLVEAADIYKLYQDNKGHCASCKHPLMIPHRTYGQPLNCLRLNFENPQECGSKRNLLRVTCVICFNLWHCVRQNHNLYARYCELFFTDSDKVDFTYTPMFKTSQRINLKLPSRMSSKAEFEKTWNEQKGCVAHPVRTADGKIAFRLLQVPLYNSCTHLLGYKVSPTDTTLPLSKSNFYISCNIMDRMRSDYSGEEFGQWLRHTIKAGPPSGSRFSNKKHTITLTEEDKSCMNQYGRTWNDLQDLKKQVKLKKRKLDTLAPVVFNTTFSMNAEGVLPNVRQLNLKYSMKTTKGRINPVTPEFVREILPSLLERHDIVEKDRLRDITPENLDKVVKDMFHPSHRGRNPVHYSLEVERMEDQNLQDT